MNRNIIFVSKRTFSQQASQNFFNIIISGGGIVGQTMACALSKNPVFCNTSILVIESNKEKEYVPSSSYSNRVSSVAPSTKKMFQKLDMWKHLRRPQVMKEMKVWGHLSSDYIDFHHDIDNPAWIVENDEVVNAALIENINSSNVKILYGSKIKNINLNSDSNLKKHQIELSNDTLLETDLLIGADGANSFVRSIMKGNYINWQYEQLGIVATVNLAEESDNLTAWQRFLPDGPVAILPLTKGISSLVWSVSKNKAKNLLKLPDEAFVDALNNALHSQPLKNDLAKSANDFSKSLLGFCNMKSYSVPLIPPFVTSLIPLSRAAFPLSFGHSSEYYKSGVVLIGDAAHKVHPLAGQGVNIGFRDIQNLESKLSQGLIDGRVLGHDMDLKNYETEALRQNVPLMAAIDALHWIYTSDNNIIKAFGNVCFQMTESVFSLKKIMKQLAS